jgi:chemotaxis protein histidine kinase CheA
MSSELSLYISVELERQMVNSAKELAQKAIMACGCHYNFDGTEAIRLLGLENVKVARQKAIVEKRSKEVIVRAAFPLPYNGELNETNCWALRQNNGLYTQCQSSRKGENSFCKACQVLADKNDGIPEYGTIQQRQAVGIFEYVDPKGRKPVSYTKVMKKYKVSEEQVLAEAGKLNMDVNVLHFVAPESELKRGRPSVKKEKVSEPKGPKGRPKKTKKVLEIAGDDEEDLFAAMVADAVSVSSDDEEEKVSKKKASEEAKAAKEAQRLKEKAEKEAKLAAEKAEKEAKLSAEKEAKRKALEDEKAEKEAKKKALEEEKAAKKAALEEEKAAKKSALEAKKAANESKKSKKPSAAASAVKEEDEEEGIRVETKKVDGKKYLVSTTGIVYDYNQWKHHQEQVVIGKWNESQQKVEFNEASDSEDEELADEYEA